MDADDEVVRYGLLERGTIEIGLEADIPYEELRDLYLELLLGQIQIAEFVAYVELRIVDQQLRKRLAELKALLPSSVLNG